MNKISKFIILLISFFLLSTYSPNNEKQNTSIIFPIKEIIIENNNIISDQQIIFRLDDIRGKNLIFQKSENIKKMILDIDFISMVKIKKIYHFTLKVFIYEKKPVAILSKNKKKYYITKQGNLINFMELKRYNNLPTVFGENMKFSELYKNLIKIDFPLNNIKSFLFFEVGRWDIILKNESIIKLPEINYLASLKHYIKINKTDNFDEYKIFDYRIKDQIILN